MTDPRISVVIAFRNGAAYMPAAVASVLAQDVPLEIILVDDGSTDEAPAVAQGLLEAHPEVAALVRQRNRGAAAARNVGLGLVRSPYVCFFDVDDTFAPGYFRAALELLDRTPDAVSVYPDVELVNMHRPVHPTQRMMIAGSISASLISRTAAVRRLGGYPVHQGLRGAAGGEDAVLRDSLGKLGRFLYLDHPYYRYLTQPGGHLDLFLDRTEVQEDGQVTFKWLTDEEQNGQLGAAVAAYRHQALVRSVAGLHEELLRVWRALEPIMPGLEGVGALLGWLGLHWPGRESIVALEGADGIGMAWLQELPAAAHAAPSVVTDGREGGDRRVRILLVDARDVERASTWLTNWAGCLDHGALVLLHGLDEAGHALLVASLVHSRFVRLLGNQDFALFHAPLEPASP